MSQSPPARYRRDLRGYGAAPPDPRWPGGARLCVQFVLNYEEGGENSPLHGDAASEAFLSEIVGAEAWPGRRHWNMESIYEYGTRAGFWRLHRLFTERGLPVTVYGVATALARGPEPVAAMQAAGWEIASHGLKWIDYRDVGEAEERRHMAEAIRLHKAVTGARPTGWYTGRCTMNTLRLVAEAGGFAWCADSYADDLPYWVAHPGCAPLLVIPYTLDANDMRFATPQGFNAGEQFLAYLKDTFDVLYAEGQAGAPKLMNVGLHCRLAGRPGRAVALARFLDYVAGHDRVWVARRIDVARHWQATHPFAADGQAAPSRLGREAFVARFAAVFPGAPWLAERVWALELGPAHDGAVGLHAAFMRAFREAAADERRAALGLAADCGEPALAAAAADAERAALERLLALLG